MCPVGFSAGDKTFLPDLDTLLSTPTGPVLSPSGWRSRGTYALYLSLRPSSLPSPLSLLSLSSPSPLIVRLSLSLRPRHKSFNIVLRLPGWVFDRTAFVFLLLSFPVLLSGSIDPPTRPTSPAITLFRVAPDSLTFSNGRTNTFRLGAARTK